MTEVQKLVEDFNKLQFTDYKIKIEIVNDNLVFLHSPTKSKRSIWIYEGKRYVTQSREVVGYVTSRLLDKLDVLYFEDLCKTVFGEAATDLLLFSVPGSSPFRTHYSITTGTTAKKELFMYLEEYMTDPIMSVKVFQKEVFIERSAEDLESSIEADPKLRGILYHIFKYLDMKGYTSLTETPLDIWLDLEEKEM